MMACLWDGLAIRPTNRMILDECERSIRIMSGATRHRLVPYEFVSPGFEGVYTGEKSSAPIDETEIITTRTTDEDGNVISRWPVFAWTFPGKEKDWDDEIRHLNEMQVRLGPLDDDTRQIRAHIGSLVPCDSGLPVTVDELLRAIGRGELSEPSFHNGCWCPAMWWRQMTTQPLHAESMRTIHAILTGYLAGTSKAAAADRFPNATGFVQRTYDWLGSLSELTEVQRLMLDRMLLPVEYFTGATVTLSLEFPDATALQEAEAAGNDIFAEGGRGSRLDAEIAEKAGLPKICSRWDEEYKKNLASIDDPARKELYKICADIASGVYALSDCHHSTFRVIESWIHGIGTGRSKISTRKVGAERERLGRLLFGYVLGLDKWLLGLPMQFLLLDLGHLDLGFDPKNEVVRVYAYLGEQRTPIKQWLSACLWHSLTYSRLEPAYPAGLVRHNELLEHAAALGLSVREWMDSAVGHESRSGRAATQRGATAPG